MSLSSEAPTGRVAGSVGLRKEVDLPPRWWRGAEGLSGLGLVNHMSQAGLDLLNCLLAYDPAKRVNARDAQRHAYFK